MAGDHKRQNSEGGEDSSGQRAVDNTPVSEDREVRKRSQSESFTTSASLTGSGSKLNSSRSSGKKNPSKMVDVLENAANEAQRLIQW